MKLLFGLVTLLVLCGSDQTTRVSIEQAVMFRDGGTIGVLAHIETEVEAGPEAVWCSLDGQFDSETRGELYVGARHPTEDGARLATAEDADLLRLFLAAETEGLDEREQGLLEAVRAAIREAVDVDE